MPQDTTAPPAPAPELTPAPTPEKAPPGLEAPKPEARKSPPGLPEPRKEELTFDINDELKQKLSGMTLEGIGKFKNVYEVIDALRASSGEFSKVEGERERLATELTEHKNALSMIAEVFGQAKKGASSKLHDDEEETLDDLNVDDIEPTPENAMALSKKLLNYIRTDKQKQDEDVRRKQAEIEHMDMVDKKIAYLREEFKNYNELVPLILQIGQVFPTTLDDPYVGYFTALGMLATKEVDEVFGRGMKAGLQAMRDKMNATPLPSGGGAPPLPAKIGAAKSLLREAVEAKSGQKIQ